MWTNLPEKPTVSYSTYRTYDECPRKWLLSQLADHLPVALEWQAKQQKTLASWDMFAGAVVDATIASALEHFRQHGAWPAQLHEIANIHRVQAWQFSKKWATHIRDDYPGPWPKTPPYQPLDRHYYAEPVSEEELRQATATIRQCVERFQHSPVRAFVTSFPVEQWRGPRPPGALPPWCKVGNAPTYAAWDFALVSDEATYILDWKSGKRTAWSEANADEQLLWYALYAAIEWQIPLHAIQVAAVWLSYDGDLAFRSVDPDHVQHLIDRINARHQELRRRIRLDAFGKIALEDWPMATKTARCRKCPFRGVCDGYKRLPPPEASISLHA